MVSALFFTPCTACILLCLVTSRDGASLPQRSENYTFDEMYSSLDHPNDYSFEIIRGRCDVDSPFTQNLSTSASSSTSPLSSLAAESCGQMAYVCTSPSIREMCDMITNTIAPTCSCQPDCGNYSSCCADHQVTADDVPVLMELNRVNECRRPFRDSRDAFMVRSYCSSEWSMRSDSGYTIRDACEEEDRLSVRDRLQLIINGTTFEKDFLSELLVTSGRTFVTYKNIFCLICNFDFYEDTSDDELIFWPVSVKCSEKPETVVADPKAGCIMDHKVNGIRPSDDRYETYSKSLIPCYAEDDGIVSDCPRGYNYDVDQRITRVKCGSIFSPVRELDGSRGSIYYRNEWCARCHGVADERIHCMDGYLPRRAPITQKKTEMKADAVLVDNIVVSAERRKGGRSERQCKPTEIFDPFIGACRVFLCHLHEDCRLVGSSAPIATSSILSFCILFLLTSMVW